ncbi:putative AlkP superfamily pyrophosphatase or phosphodiesterase [Bacillus pakistanensis]|uniref:AlkP superfamily pyrophosphatase or phosphodiesterase n=1 Tax=Rossellomorea pakistanensis TaxID=992288 RepID=A0ABS2NJT3_9BACI|nr:alkaline phosphatase family protein [Bacillus pakistanensis]MBM7587786.1 putative AlkP superfamily pyrophosphatase or phosphodiesterase [Bacillus pakistanensis]
MGFRLIFIVLFLSILLSSCSLHKNNEGQVNPIAIQTNNQTSPKVVLIVIDSLMDKPLKKAIQENKAPALAFFLNHGRYNKNLVSSYPTMSITIDSSLITGTYPDRHKIPGLVWYDEGEQRIINYGNGFFEMMKIGAPQFAEDTLYQFNNVDLSPNVETIHEVLDNRGKPTASINSIIHRGNYEHTLKMPKILSKTTKMPDQYNTLGPKVLSLGTFIRQDRKNPHLLNRLGLNDAFAAQELKYLLKKNILPEFSIIYLPVNDHVVHRKGPMTTEGIEELDKHLQEVLNAYPTWQNALDNMIWIIIGDSKQSFVKKNKKEALIDLRKALSNYKILSLGEPVRKKDELVITANERMAYVYKISNELSLKDIASKLQTDERIAWIAWKDKEMIQVRSGVQDGVLQFKPDGVFTDNYNQTWSIKGNSSILDLSIKNNNQIKYGDYPDVLARLYGAIHSQKGDFLIVDAKPGYEFIGESSPEHTGGGAHGSMHKTDSLTPIIVTGTNKSMDHLRIVDLKEWILDLLE